MGKTFKLGDLEVKPGEIRYGTLGAVELADTSRIEIPLIVVRGKEDGPVFTVAAAVHGTEVSAIGSLLEAIKEIDPGKMRGTLVGIPGANPFAVQNGTYTTYVDELNLSSGWFFKADPRETITQRLAAYIDEALKKSDLIVDMHANPLPSIHFVMLDIDTYASEKTKKDTWKMAEAYGVTPIEMPVDKPATMRACATANGIPALTVELAGSIYLWDEINRVGATGLLNIMKEFDMLEGEPVKQDEFRMEGEFRHHSRLVANRGGLMWVKKAPGEFISKGDTVIEITDLYGRVVEEIKMPVDGYCWSFPGGINGTHAVPEGSKIAYVFYRK